MTILETIELIAKVIGGVAFLYAVNVIVSWILLNVDKPFIFLYKAIKRHPGLLGYASYIVVSQLVIIGLVKLLDLI